MTGLALVLAGVAASGAWAEPRAGDVVRVAGRVVDAAGEPIAGATVVLEAYRTGFDLLRMKRRDQPPVLSPTTTGEDGRFALDWSWNRIHDRFELVVGAAVNHGGEASVEAFLRNDATAAMAGDQANGLRLVVDDDGVLRWLVGFAASGGSEDERKIFGELGRPDRVDREQRDDGLEITWWYFDIGKAYRFVGGRLTELVHFDPVPDSVEDLRSAGDGPATDQ